MPGVRQEVGENLSGGPKEACRNLRVELMLEGQCPSAHPGRRSFLDLAKHYHLKCHKKIAILYK